jgi:DNA-binding GntR family transcriptional regulator
MTSPAAYQLPPPAETAVRQSSGDQAALYIRRLIFDGLLRPGDRVPQDAIAERLGLSRVPVREALFQLEREGWVVIRPHRGTFIEGLDEAAVYDHYALYGHFYTFAAMRAAERATPEQMERLVELQKQIKEATDPRIAWKLNRAFHGVVVEAARTGRMRLVLRALSGLVPGNFFELVPGSMDVEKKGTAAIVRALRRRDAEKAAAAYAAMMRRQGELVVALFRERGLFPDQGRVTTRVAG